MGVEALEVLQEEEAEEELTSSIRVVTGKEIGLSRLKFLVYEEETGDFGRGSREEVVELG